MGTQAISTLTAEKNQEIANARTSIQQSEQRIVSETDKVTRDITVQSQANITLYKTGTENTRAVQQLQVETTRANTEQEVRRIRENMDRETVANDYQIRMIQANRDAAKAQISSAAEADAIRIIANATQTVLKNLTDSIGFSAEELNVLSWTDMVAAYRKVHLDLQRPSVMLLPGQQELFYESLSNSNS